MDRAQGFPLLDLPETAISVVFDHLTELSDSVSLSKCCRQLWALGAGARRRHLCCASCGHRVLLASESFSHYTYWHTPRVDLPDGRTYAVEAEHVAQGCTMSAEEYNLQATEPLFCLRAGVGIRQAGDPDFPVRVRHMQCRGCGLHLGVRFTRLGPLRLEGGQGEGQRGEEEIVMMMPEGDEGDEGADVADARYWRELQLLGVCLLAKRYLRLHTDSGREEHLGRPPPLSTLALYVCTGQRSTLRKPGECGSVLFEQRDILSRQHCWDAGDGVERAFYVNHFLPGAVSVCNEREEELCQGGMRVADVHCSTCGAAIGWKFCSDLTPDRDNCNQVGRYGVVESSLQRVEGGKWVGLGSPPARCPATPGP